jgi:putative endopeptidase
VFSACGQKSIEKSIVEGPKLLGSGISLANMDDKVRPGDDFFSYVNGAWISRTEIPVDKGRYGAFDVLRDESQEAVKAIIEESAAGNFANGTDEQKVGDLYRSYLDIETRDALGMRPLIPELARIDAILNNNELAVYFASAIKRNMDVPLGFGQLADFKDPTRYSIGLFSGGLGLPDREYYLKEDAISVELRQKYVAHIEAIFNLAGINNAASAAKKIMELETRLAEQNMPKEEARNWTKNYNAVSLNDLPSLMPNFNWEGYLSEAGLEKIGKMIVFRTEYVKALDDILVNTDLETWKSYLKWRAVDSAATRLTSSIDAQNFEFYGKALSGTAAQRPMWRRAVNTVNRTLGEVVGKVYVKRHFPPEAKERMLILVGNLISAYEKSIKELDWMSDETKLEALDKLSKFTPKIGYPDDWRDYSALEIDAADYYGNIERAVEVEYKRQMDRHDEPVDRTEWGMTPQTVNAYYNPLLNEIVFPAAILQPPFFNLEAEEAVNYGGIGAVIGHEIGHGFDDSGANFDGDGVMRNWWTKADLTEFKNRTEKLVEQYNAFKPFDDLSINGEYTLGENIGDLSGISISLLAYKMSLDGIESPVIDGFTGVQRVFLGFGQVWSGKYRDKTLRLQIETDPHAPSKYRANGSVRNVPEFYEAFDIHEDDALYLAPKDRVKIW